MLNTLTEHWSGNIYNTVATPKTPFSINHVSYSSSYWLSQIDPTGRQASVSYPNPGVTMASYNASLGQFATDTSILSVAATQSQQSWNPSYTTTAILSYFRGAFGGGPERALLA